MEASNNWLFRHWAPCNFKPTKYNDWSITWNRQFDQLSSHLPVTPKLQSSSIFFSTLESVIVTSNTNSSNDQLFAWAIHWRVAVIYASGLSNPPSHTGNVYATKNLINIVHEISCNSISHTFICCAPLDTSWDTCCSCLILSLKSVIHWITVQPRGTVYLLQLLGMIPLTRSLSITRW